MIWKPGEKPEWRKRFPLFNPIVLDDGTRILWEMVECKTTITREWEGMGAGGCEGYREYRLLDGSSRVQKYLGRASFKS